MRHMRRRRLVVFMGVGVLLGGSAPAHAQGLLGGVDDVVNTNSAVEDPVGTVTSTANDVVGTANDAVGTANDAVGTATGTANDAAGTVTSTATGTAGSLVGGSSTGSQGTASSVPGTGSSGSGGASSRAGRSGGSRGDRRAPGRSYHTRFDRLPRRAEVLLERIELGRHPRANLRRLEALLRRSPELRPELARALRSEVARLRKGGLTNAERRQLHRLAHVQQALTPSASGSSTTQGSTLAPARHGSASLAPLTGVKSASTSQQHPTSQTDDAHAPPAENGSGNGILGTPLLPGGVDGWPGWVLVLLDVVLGLSILALVALFVAPFRNAFR
jgi:hypothetical protein